VSEGIRKVIVAGSGSVAWIAAAGLMRALRSRALDICVVDTGPEEIPVGRWTLPSQRGMHGLLGINESHFVQHTGATYRLASEHLGWQGDGSRFLHAHGDIGTDLGGTPFYKYLQSEALAGRSARPEEFSLAGAAAILGRFARPMGTDLTASFTYGFQVAEREYSQYLRAHAERLGVRATSAPLADVVLADNGNIAAVRLTDGSLAEGDLFVDCSGATARLIGGLSNEERDDWSAWLPADRILSAIGPALPDAPPITQTLAVDAGWFWRAPLAGRSMIGLVYGNAWLDDESARARLVALEPALQGDPVLAKFSAGRRSRVWVRNCVALGDAAAELEPLVGAGLHFAQLGLATLVELFPLNRASSIESVEYNRVMAEHADALRDFTIAHYRVGRARPGDFWNAARTCALPAELTHKLDLYSASGRLHVQDHETFEELDWAWLLIGSGCIPAAVEVQVRNNLAKLTPRDVEILRNRVQQVAASMPPHAEFVRRQSTPAARVVN
jgi:tryptophan halogenase